MSFTNNFLKALEKKGVSTTNNAGGTTPPASSGNRSSGSGDSNYTNNFLSALEKQKDMTISERASARVKALQKKQQEYARTPAGILSGRSRSDTGLTTSGGYYSRPTLGSDGERLYGNVTALEPVLTEKRAALDTAQTSLLQAENDLKTVQGYLDRARADYNADPTNENANSYNQIVGAYNLAYDSYTSALDAYSHAYDDYKPYEDQLIDALAIYQLYSNQQQAAFDDWRGTIRDAATIQTEITAIDQQMADLEVAEAARQQQLAEHQAQQDAKPWYEKLAGYLGGAQDTTLPIAGVTPGVVEAAFNQPEKTPSREMQQLIAMKELLQEELNWSQYYYYADFAGAPDFAEMSKYVPQEEKEQRALDIMLDNYSSDAAPWEDPLYEYINGNEEAGAWLSNAGANYYGPDNAIGAFFGRATENKAESQQMTEQEVATFNYLYATQGKAAAHAYYDYLLADLNYRQRKSDEEYWAEYAARDPVGSSVFSVAMSPAKGLAYLGQAADLIDDGEIAENAQYNKFSYIPSKIREKVPENWGAVGTFAYQTGMSMADFLLTTAITGGNQAAALTIMGSGAAADTTIAAKDRGLEDWQAYTLGTVAGLAEVLTEKVSLDKLFDADLLADGTLKYIMGNAFAEGAEEVASSTVNLLADIIVSKDKSEWAKSIDVYMAKGLTEDQAFARAMADQALSLGVDFLGGFISGGVMGGGGAVVGNINTQKIGNKLGDLQMGDEDIQEMIETCLEAQPGSTPYKVAQEIQAKIKKGQTITGNDKSRLYQAATQAQPNAGWDETADTGDQNDTVAGTAGDPENISLPTLDGETDRGEVSAEALRRQAQADYRAGKITKAEFDAIIDEAMHLEEGTSVKTFDSPAGINGQADNINENVNGGTTYGNIQQQSGWPAAARPAGEYGTEGADLPDGGRQRYDGESAGEQDGVLASSPEQRRRAYADRSRATVARQNYARSLRLEKVSSQDLGLQNGTEERNIQVMPQEHWDSEMSQLADRIYNETGKGVTYVMGRIQIRGTGGAVSYARGVITGDRIIVQADHLRISMEQIADHEVYHAKVDFAAENRLDLNAEIKRHILDTFSAEQFQQVLEKYIVGLRGVIDVNEAQTGEAFEAAVRQIEEEIFADAYAGINAFGANADQFTGAVNERMDQLYLGKIRSQDNGTEEPTGPPTEERFSAAEPGGLNLPTLDDDSDGDYSGRSLTNDRKIYSYDFLASQPDMNVVFLPGVETVRDETGKIDTAKIISEGIKNALSVGTERDGKIYVTNRYTGHELRITTSSIRHGLNGAMNRKLTNARLGSMIGEIVQNAIPINALHNTADDVTGTYAMAGYAADKSGREFIAIVTVEQRGDAVAGVDVYDVTHAVSGRQKRSNRQNPIASMGEGQADTKSQGFNLIKASSKISVADLLAAVKDVYQSILSDDVLSRMGETRNPEGHYTGRVRYSYAGENANNADLEALERAKEMRSAGVADETIRQQTGWHTGMDGKWRWEIDDSGMRYDSSGDLRGAESAKWAMEDYESARADLWGHADMGTLEKVRAYNRADIAGDDATKQELYDELINGQYAYYFDQYVEAMTRAQGARNAPAGGTLQDYIDHPALFEAYPQLRNVTLRFERMGGGMMGYYSRTDNEIVLNTELRYAAEDTLVHEIQHAIQKAEGFTRGSNEEYWKHRQDGDDAVHVYDAKIQESEKKMDEIMRQLPENVAEQFRQWSAMDESSPEAMALMQELWDSPYNDLFEDYWFLNFGLDDMRRTNHKRGYRDLYRNTAGEIEARDVTARRSLTSDQRRSQEPARGDSYTVFMEDSDELSLQMGDRYSADDVDSHGHSLTPEQQEFYAQSQARDSSGRLLVLYHQTDGDFTIFDTRHPGAGSKDSDTPFGIFLKQTAGDIGLAGKKQMALYANITNPLRAANREDLARQLREISGSYASISDKHKQLDAQYHEKFEQAKKAWRDYIIEWRAANPGANRSALNDDPKFNELFDAEDAVVDEWTAAADLLSTQAKEAITEDLRKAGYDGVFLENDVGSWGRRTDAIIALDPQQVKNISNKTPTSNPDIRYSVDDGGQDPAQQQPAAPKKKIRPVAESRPLIAKKDLRSTVLNLFSIPNGQRAEVGAMIDSYADRLIKNGSLTEDDRKAFFDRLYDAGVMVMPAEEYSAFARSHIVDGRIYVSDSVKSDFGDDWADIRRRAFAAGVYLVNDRSASGIDQWNATLSAEDMLPGLFDSEETDERTILERILQVAEEGKDEHLSLAEYTRRLSQQEGISEDEFLDNMERQLDWALRTFAEKARLEVHLRDRTGRKIAQEREKGAERMTRQQAKEAQRRANERQARKDSARRAKERRELRELQQRTLKQLQWLSKNRFRAPEELQATWDEVLSDIDIYAISAADEMRWSDKHNATWRDLAQMYKDAMKNDPNFLPSKELERIVTRLDATKIADMDLGALQDLYKAAIGLRTEFYNRNNVVGDEMQRLFAEVYTDAKREIESAPGENSAKKGKVSGWADKFLNLDQLTPMNVLQRMAGWDPNGAFYSMAKQLERGERDMRAYSVKAQKMLQDFLTEHEDWVKKADGQGKDGLWYKIEIPELVALELGKTPQFGGTIEVWMTPMQKIHMYLESKNQDNLRHMTGGRTFADKQIYSEGKRQEAFAQGKTVRMAPETVKAIVKDLTAEEMELAQILDRYYNTFATQEINKVSNILYGYDKAMGKNYAPIYTNQNYTRTEFGVFDTTAEGIGNLKGRQYAVNPSYNISAFDAFERHVDQTARFVGMAIPARNWTTLMNWREQHNSTGDVITHKWGEQGKKYIEDLITTLQAGDDAKSESVSTLASRLQSNYISAVFGANPSIVLKQLGSIPLAGAYLDARNMPTPAQISKIDRSLISKYTQELEWRTMGYATPETKQLKDNPNWTQTNKAFKFVFGGGAITAMDGWAASTLWPWAENKVRREHPELVVGTKAQIDAGESAFYKKVAEEFEIAVSRSQSVSDEIHQGTLRKSKNPITKAFTMFRSDSAQTYNALRQKIGEARYYMRTGAKEKVVQTAKKAAGTVFVAMLLNAAWSEAVSFLMALWKNKGKYYRDDEDELTFQSVAGEMVSNMLGSLSGVVTFGEEAFEIIGNILTGEKIYDIETPGMEQLNDLIDAVTTAGGGMRDLLAGGWDVLKNGGNLGDYFSKHSGEMLGGIKDLAKAAAMYLSGMPASNLEAYLTGAMKWISPELGAAYDDLFAETGKSDLAGMEGDSLEGRVGRILSDRNVSESDDTAAALAALYEAGYKTAIPSDTPTSVSIDGEKHSLGDYQQQAYDTIWGGIVADALDDMVASDSFKEADPKTQAKMLENLYDYAAERAKAELFDEYEMDTGAAENAAIVAAGETIAECITWNTITSGKNPDGTAKMKSGEKAAELVSWDIPEEAKREIFRCKISDSREDSVAAFDGAGLSFDQFLQAYSMYGQINNEDLKAGMKAVEFSHWVNAQGYTAEQAAVVKDELTYFNMTPASSSRYDELVGAGMDPDEAYDLTGALNELQPEDGADEVSDLQKWRASVDFSDDVEDQLAALSAVMTDAQFLKVEIANNFGVTPDAYVTLQEIKSRYDADGNGSYKNAEIQAAVDGLPGYYTTEQKAVLWQLATGSTSARNNPYSRQVGQQVLDARAAAKEAAAQEQTEAPTDSTDDDSFSQALLDQLLGRG